MGFSDDPKEPYSFFFGLADTTSVLMYEVKNILFTLKKKEIDFSKYTVNFIGAYSQLGSSLDVLLNVDQTII